jgi:transcriptional regulator GlxA family with amidase domain
MPRTPLREIVLLLYPDFQSLDLTGPLEVFAGAHRLVSARSRREPGYKITLLSRDGEPLSSSSGLRVIPDGSLADAPAAIDTLLIVGGPGCGAAAEDEELLEWLRGASAEARRTASVCTGAFVLAAAGLLDGRRATTHWAAAALLGQRHPQIDVDPDPIFLRDGAIWTSAGVTAGMDLALALVEQDLDREAALEIARHLVLFLRRPGNQSQFSATLSAQQPRRDALRESQRLVLEDIAGDHTVAAMAARAHMSERHFARAFRAEVGLTPARYVERVRLEAARRRLEEGGEPVAAVARACGFGTAETMRRAFLRAFHVNPAEYRRRFHTASTERAA